MFCSCEMSSNCWLQIIFCSRVNETTLFSFFILVPRATPEQLGLQDHVTKKRRALGTRMLLLSIAQDKLGDRMKKQLLSSVIVKYRNLSVSCRSISCLPQPSAESEVVLFDPRVNELASRPFPRCPNKTASFAFVALCYYCFVS